METAARWMRRCILWYWRIHIVLVALLAIAVGGTMLVYRYYGGLWSPFGIKYALFALLPGLIAWLLRARQDEGAADTL